MKLLIDILHPAHVHFFKGYIERARAGGHHVTIVTRNKEITNALLDRLDISYRPISTPARNAPGLAFELLQRWCRILTILIKEKIDLAMSISGLSTALPSRMMRIPNINFTDTEDARLSNMISFPFSDIIATPAFFLHNLGKKHFRYEGLHELSYLKHFDMKGLGERARFLGLPKRYVIIRLIAKDALHDIGVTGIPTDGLTDLIRWGETLGRVFINSQSRLPERFDAYRLPVPIEEIHVALASALLFIGESPTMAVESSLLGTPAFLVSSRWKQLGNMIHLDKDLQLLRNFSTYDSLVHALEEIKDPLEMKSQWQDRAARFRKSSADVEKTIEHLVHLALSKRRQVGAIA